MISPDARAIGDAVHQRSVDATNIVVARLTANLFGGQQRVEHELLSQLSAMPRPGIRLRTVEVGGLRSPAPARAPLRFLGNGGALDRAASAFLYGGASLVHRMDARLPSHHREILTLHDLSFIRFRDEGRVSPRLAEQAHAALRIVTVSEFSAQELRTAWGLTNVVVIPNACESDVALASPLLDDELLARGIVGPYVVAGGGDTERKNWPMLREVWARFAERDDFGTHLVLTGPDTVRRRAMFAGLPRVVHVGFQSRREQLGIVAGARIMLVPSFYEGFGLPVIEAMTAGVPVIALNRSSLPEVAGDAAVLLEPSPEEWTSALRELSRDDSARDDLVTRGRAHAATFSWERSASQLLDLYETYG